MSTLYERFQPTPDDHDTCSNTVYSGQNFTIGNTGSNVSHQAYSVKVYAYKVGTPGTLTVGLYAVDGSGFPTGVALCSATYDGNSLTTSTSGQLIELVWDSNPTLSASTKYIFYGKCLTGDGSNNVKFLALDAGGYTGGDFTYSVNAGVAWNNGNPADLYFEEYGVDTTPKPSVSDTTNITESVTMKLISNINVNDTTAITDTPTLNLLSRISVQDTTPVTEGINMQQVYLFSLSETTVITELITMMMTSNIVVQDTTNITELITMLEPILTINGVNDTTVITELITMRLFSNVTVSDTTVVSELITMFIPILTINVSETTNINENITMHVIGWISPTKHVSSWSNFNKDTNTWIWFNKDQSNP